MELIEFLIAVFLVATMPSCREGGELIYEEQPKNSLNEDWRIVEDEDENYFHIAGMWVGKHLQFK